LKAVDVLTVGDEGRLRKQLYGAQKDAAQIEGLRSDLREKERTIEALLSRQANLEQFVQSLVDSGAVKHVPPRKDGP
jgi:predicted transcriptional regulator